MEVLTLFSIDIVLIYQAHQHISFILIIPEKMGLKQYFYYFRRFKKAAYQIV